MSADDYSSSALRTGTWHFLTGKLLSAMLTVTALLWAVRLLPVGEYAGYVTMFATVEFCLVVGSFGLPWMAARYIPEFNLRASGSHLRRLCLRLLGLQALALALVVVLLSAVLFGSSLSLGFQGETLPVVAVGLMLFVEGLGRFVRDSLLGPLMMQRASRLSLVLRQLLLVLGIAAMARLDVRTALALLLVECVAATVSTAVAIAALLSRLRRADGPSGADESSLTAADGLRNYGVALRMYGAHLLSLTYSPLLMLHVVQRTAGVEAAALFGFLRLLHDQIARYLPAMLLFSLIRPKLMAGFVQGGLADLSRNVNLCGKLSLFVLCPIIAAVAVGGDTLVDLLSSGRFPAAGMVMFGFLLALVPYSQRQLLESVAVASSLSRLCLIASALSALCVPVIFLFWPPPFGVPAAILSMIAGHALFDLVLTWALRRKVGFHGDPAGWGKLGLAAVLAYATGTALAGGLEQAGLVWWPWAAGAGAVGSFVLVSWWLKPFSAEERGRLNAFAGRRLFVW